MCDIRRYRTVVSHCVQSDLPPPSMLNRYIYYALLRAVIAQINAKLSLRCAQCMFKLDSQLFLRVCTLTTHHVRVCACCWTSATTMDQWSISWSSSSTSHAHSLLNEKLHNASHSGSQATHTHRENYSLPAQSTLRMAGITAV